MISISIKYKAVQYKSIKNSVNNVSLPLCSGALKAII
jgi:hypothetical protein